MADHEVFEEPNFVLQKGAMLPVARLTYKTVGSARMEIKQRPTNSRFQAFEAQTQARMVT